MNEENISSPSRPGRADFLALALLFLLIWAPFLVRLLRGLTSLSGPLTHDIGFQWIPFRMMIRGAVSQGVFPLWADGVFAGFPFAAFSHSGVFYPLGWLFLLGEYARVANFFYPLHLCIAGAGVYALSRQLRLPPPAALLAAITYTFTGKPFYFIHFLPSVCSNVWLPWFLFSSLCLLSQARFRHFVLAGLFLAFQVLGGDVESTAYGLLFGLPLLFLGWSEQRTIRSLFFLVSLFLLCLFFSSLQLLPLTELSERFVRNQGVTFSYFSQRRLPLEIFWAVLLPIKGLARYPGLELEAPYFYLGISAWWLAMVSVWGAPTPRVRTLGVLTLLALSWSLGSLPLLERVQFLLPILDRFGSPEHAFFVGQLFLALLAGHGFQALAENRPRFGRVLTPLLILLLLWGLGHFSGMVFLNRSLFSWLLLFLFLVLTIVSLNVSRAKKFLPLGIFPLLFFDVYVLAFRFLPANPPSLFQSPAWLSQLGKELQPTNSRAIMVSRLGLQDPDLLYHWGLAGGVATIDGWITTPLRDYAEFMARIDPRAASFREGKLDHLGLNCDLRDGLFLQAESFPLLDLLSLRYLVNRGLPLKFSSPFYLSYLPPEYHRRSLIEGAASRKEKAGLAERSQWGEDLFAATNEVYRYRLFVNQGDVMTFLAAAFHEDLGRGSAKGEVRVEVRSGGSVETIYEEEMKSQAANPLQVHLEPRGLDLSKWWGREVELLLQTQGPPERKDLYFWMVPTIINPTKPLRLWGRPAPEILVYENQEALPRAFLVHQAEVIPEAEKLLSRLKQASRWELSQRIFLSREPAGALPPEGAIPLPSGQEFALLARTRPGEEVYQVHAASPGYLFIANQYYPGWRAFREGEEVRLLRADHCFRAVAVPSGVSVIRLVYQPASFRIGLFLTLASSFFALVLSALRRIRR